MPRGANRWDSRLPHRRPANRRPAAIISSLFLAAALIAALAPMLQAPAAGAAALAAKADARLDARAVITPGPHPQNPPGVLSDSRHPTSAGSNAQPSSTPQPSSTNTVQPSNTPLPTATSTPTATGTNTSTPTITPTPTATAPPPWQRYTVRGGENLSTISSRVGVATDSLSVANGLSHPNLIYPGETLYVPPAGWKPPWLDKKQQEDHAAQIAAALPWLRYTVRAGDALSLIAQSYNVDMTTLAKANAITAPENILVGQVLHIPPKGWKVGMAKPSFDSAALQASFPALPKVAAAQGAYTVRGGDNLTGIALRYGVSVGSLAANNGLASTDLIYVGQNLTIPGKGASMGGSAYAATYAYSGGGDESVVAPPSMSPDSIDQVLQQYNSPAAGTGLTFYSLGVQYGIDPAYALAFFIHESSGGTQGVAAYTRSIGNIIYTPGYSNYQGFRAYSSWEEGIADWYQLITGEYVLKMGRSTVSEIIPVYAPASENDVPGYINAVMSLVYSWRGSGGYFDALGGAGLRANLVPRAYHVTSEFGHYPDGSPHYGIDLDATIGVEQTAPVGGVVVEVHTGCLVGDTSCGKGLGNHIWWRSAATGHFIVVGHLSEVNPALEEGAIIGAGAVLGMTGATGYATGPHVHIQVNPSGPDNAGSIDPSWEFPWLVCTDSSPLLGQPFGNAACDG